MASSCIAQASCETNVEFKSYILLDRALREARGIYESFASIVENSGPLPTNFSESLFYFEVQERVARFFSNPRPRRLEPEDYFEIPLEWTDVIRESLTLESFEHAIDDLYHCCVQGKWIEVTENDRSEILCGVLNGLLDSLGCLSESRQRQKFQNHFDKTFAFVQKLSADMEKTKQRIKRAEHPRKGGAGNRTSNDILNSTPPPFRGQLRSTSSLGILRDRVFGPTLPDIAPPLSTKPKIPPSDAGRKPDTVENGTKMSAGNDAAPVESEISYNNTEDLACNREAEGPLVVREITSTINKEASGQVSGAIDKENGQQVPGALNTDSVGQPVNKTACPTIGAINKVAVSQTPITVIKETSSQTPVVANKEAVIQIPNAINKVAVSKRVNNIVSRTFSHTTKTSISQAVSAVTKDAAGHTIKKAIEPPGADNTEAVGQIPSNMNNVAVSRLVNNTVNETPRAINKDGFGQIVNNSLVQTPRVIYEDAISQTLNNAEDQTPRTGAVFQPSGVIDKMATLQKAPDTILESVTGQNSGIVYKETVGQIIAVDKQTGYDVILDKRTGRAVVGTVDGYLVYKNDVATQSTAKVAPDTADKTVVDENYDEDYDDDVESVGSDIPYDINSRFTSNSNSAVAQFESMKRRDVSARLSKEARREALTARYSHSIRGSKVYTSREMEEAPEFIRHILDLGYSEEELEDEYNWIFRPNHPRTADALFRKFFGGRKRKQPSESSGQAKRLKGLYSGITIIC